MPVVGCVATVELRSTVAICLEFNDVHLHDAKITSPRVFPLPKHALRLTFISHDGDA